MNVRKPALLLVLSLAVASLAYAADNPNMGTWKLNDAKSKFFGAAVKNTTVVYEAAGDQVKVTTDGTTPDGKPAHSEWTGKFDGKDYPVTGGDPGLTRSYKVVNDRTLNLITKKDGKAVSTGRVVLSSDGKSRTVAIKGVGLDGKPMHYSAFYDKQ